MPHPPHQRMKPLDRVLCVTAALFGIGAFSSRCAVSAIPATCIPAGSCPSVSSA